ncbi:MAG: S-layer homology domain-containing protein [Lachnospiraceae bacterium]|nr:S-layer homology domain-containing protein [Lachnospiraceae bacterium]
MKREIKRIICLFLSVLLTVGIVNIRSISVKADGSVVDIFSDVKAGQWYVNAVQYVYDRGIMIGTNANTFGVSQNLQREQFAQILYSMAGKPTVPADAQNPFKDVKNYSGYPRDAILWAYSMGIVAGNGDGTFGVGEAIQRQAVASMLYKYAQSFGYDLTSNQNAINEFNDKSNIAEWAKPAMNWAVTQGIISGKGNGKADSTGNTTRAECACMIKKLLILSQTTGKIRINLLVAAIDPMLYSVDGNPFGNGCDSIKASEYLRFSLDDSLMFWCNNFMEISHNTVDINIVDTVIIDEFPKYKSIDSLDNESFQRLFKKDADGFGDWYSGITDPEYAQYDTCGDLDYQYYIDKLDLVKRKNANEFNMVFLIGIDPLSPFETSMVGRHPFYVNGGIFEADCDNFVIITPTFSRQDGSLEDIGHMAENMLGYSYSEVYYSEGLIDGSDYSALNDWEKYCLCKYIATPNTEVYGYGMVHFSPNSERDYDWANDNIVKYYKDWRNGSDIQEFSASECYLNDPLYSYNHDPCISHHRWWFYNMPYEKGRDKEGYYNSWWRYIFTPDYVTHVLPENSYSDSKITIKVGDKKTVPFILEYFTGQKVHTDSCESLAFVSVSNSNLSVEDGRICGKKAGKSKVTVKIDGKSLVYNVIIE